MERSPVTSKALVSVGYDSDAQVLELELTSGAVYQYFGVPEEEHRALIDAPSQGQYFVQNIRNRYSYAKQ